MGESIADTSRMMILLDGERMTNHEQPEAIPLTPLHKSGSRDDTEIDRMRHVPSSLLRSQSLSSMRQLTINEDFLIGRREGSKLNIPSRAHSYIRITEVAPSNSAIVNVTFDEVDTAWKFPVQIFSEKKQGKDSKNLPKRIRSYYNKQDELIRAFEDIQLDTLDMEAKQETDTQLRRRALILAKVSFAANLMLLLIKAVAVYMSGSIAIISSLVDSVVDLLSGVIIWWTSRAMKKRNIYTYPGGKSRLEPVAIVILSVVMSLASFQLIVESLQKVADFTKKEGDIPTVKLTVILIAVSTVVVKLILFLLCYCLARMSPSVKALYRDHRNDVMSNIVAIICGYFGSQQFIDKTTEYNVVYIDPIGAILISIYILVDWWRTGYEQIKLLTGHSADPNFLSKITWICLNHHQDIIMIDTVRAFHFGSSFLVEVDVVLPADMSLKETHNIGETLQQKLEMFPLVERAFVHLDYETTHHPNEEHKLL